MIASAARRVSIKQVAANRHSQPQPASRDELQRQVERLPREIEKLREQVVERDRQIAGAGRHNAAGARRGRRVGANRAGNPALRDRNGSAWRRRIAPRRSCRKRSRPWSRNADIRNWCVPTAGRDARRLTLRASLGRRTGYKRTCPASAPLAGFDLIPEAFEANQYGLRARPAASARDYPVGRCFETTRTEACPAGIDPRRERKRVGPAARRAQPVSRSRRHRDRRSEHGSELAQPGRAAAMRGGHRLLRPPPRARQHRRHRKDSAFPGMTICRLRRHSDG